MRKLQGKGLGLALGKIDQDVGNIVRLVLQIDAGDHVRSVLLLGQPRRFGIGGGLRQRIDAGALRIAFPRGSASAWTETNSEAPAPRATRTRSASGTKVSSVRVISTRYLPVFFEAVAQAQRDVQHNVLFQFSA